MNVERAPDAPAFPARLEPGMMFGAYEVLLSVARGGMARVWAARQHGARGFTRLVALKTVLPELDEPEFEEMFVDEARVAARIHHPNVCEIFELIEHEGVLGLSMEWIDGGTLNAIIERAAQARPLEARVAAQIVAQAAAGLHAAHSLLDDSGAPMQLVHRDVSPQNILISRAGHVKVADFGIAKALGGSREATAVGQIKGKLSYMSPEQADGKPLDRRSDIFSLGVVLYQATVGLHPFKRANQAKHELLFRLLLEPITPPSKLVASYPPELEAIVMRALARSPDERFATADELRSQLQDWLVRTGPLVTEHDVARLVAERIGPSITKRAARIHRAVEASRYQDTGMGTGRVPKLGYSAPPPAARVSARLVSVPWETNSDAPDSAQRDEAPETSQVQPSARTNLGALPEVTDVPALSAAGLGVFSRRPRARTLALAAAAVGCGALIELAWAAFAGSPGPAPASAVVAVSAMEAPVAVAELEREPPRAPGSAERDGSAPADARSPSSAERSADAAPAVTDKPRAKPSSAPRLTSTQRGPRPAKTRIGPRRAGTPAPAARPAISALPPPPYGPRGATSAARGSKPAASSPAAVSSPAAARPPAPAPRLGPNGRAR